MEKKELVKYRVQVGIQLKRIRHAQGWTAAQVAAMADVKTETVEKIEAGVFNVPMDVLTRVADVLDCEINITAKS